MCTKTKLQYTTAKNKVHKSVHIHKRNMNATLLTALKFGGQDDEYTDRQTNKNKGFL